MPSRTGSLMDVGASHSDALHELYPFVDQGRTPLPTQWNHKDKHSNIGLSHDCRTVHYKGNGKSHKDAASVRATHPIPATCGMYYFEVKIISKGRDGYMGLGYSTKSVSLNRLPGWDKQSYGYHGDDGCVFCSSGSGSSFGPTYGTGDIIGCGLHLADRNCFFTKNGQKIGHAFAALPNDLYPVIGLQTPGEVMQANFGQEPFFFDIEGEIKEAQARVCIGASHMQLHNKHHEIMSKLVLTYLAHQGFHDTAELYSESSSLPLKADPASIRNRQKIRKSILAGKIGHAVEQIREMYPGLLDQNTDLLFMLKCRQFIEMVNRPEFELQVPGSSKSAGRSLLQSTTSTTSQRFRVTQQPYSKRQSALRSHISGEPACLSAAMLQSTTSTTSQRFRVTRQPYSKRQSALRSHISGSESPRHSSPLKTSSPRLGRSLSRSPGPVAVAVQSQPQNGFAVHEEMVSGDESMDCGDVMNGVENGKASSEEETLDCCDMPGIGELIPERGWSPQDVAYYKQLLEFGHELLQFSNQLQVKHGPNAKNRQMLEKAYALLAYPNPTNSPVSYQLDPSQREAIASAVNSAILLREGAPPQAPLESLLKHSEHLQQTMAGHGLGACAFTHPKQVINSDL